MSLQVETLFDIDNLPSIKAYPKSPTHVLHEQWSECIELASDRCDPSSSLVINNPHTTPPINDTLIQTSVPTRDIKIEWHDWFVNRCEVNCVQLMH